MSVQALRPQIFSRSDSDRPVDLIDMLDRIVFAHVGRIVGAERDMVGAEFLDQIVELVGREDDRVEDRSA